MPAATLMLRLFRRHTPCRRCHFDMPMITSPPLRRFTRSITLSLLFTLFRALRALFSLYTPRRYCHAAYLPYHDIVISLDYMHFLYAMLAATPTCRLMFRRHAMLYMPPLERLIITTLRYAATTLILFTLLRHAADIDGF